LKVSVIIPAFNEERLLPDTLRHVQAASAAFFARGWQIETIVCDNNSTDSTAQIASAAGATVVFEPVNRIGGARNCGASAASGDWLIFVDADCKPSRELFEEVAKQIASGDCLVGGSTVVLDGEFPWANRFIGIWNWLSRRFSLLAGSFIFCEAAAFREVAGFSNELFAGEEIDLSKKLKALAAELKKRVVILDQYPLVTSPRKLQLYTLRRHLWFMARAALLPASTLRDRNACSIWYDGKR
jgi:glycosyltransferase involved in cell wall biosynthesis